jgi:type IV secretion system protein VirB1
MIPAALLACILHVSPVTMAAIVSVESGSNPVALNVNYLRGPQPHPHSAEEAARMARRYIAQGYSVDLGLAQVNDRNLSTLGLTVEQVLDPCTNLRAGATILTADYAGAVRLYGEGQTALHAALSAYNTGSFWKGDAYVSKFVPGLRSIGNRRANIPRRPNPYAADTDVAWVLD